MLYYCQEIGFVGWYVEFGCVEKEWLVMFVGVIVDQVGCFCVGVCDDDVGYLYDVELEVGGVELFDLFVGWYQDFVVLVVVFFGVGLLVFDVVVWYIDFDEVVDQVVYVWIVVVVGVGVGDDKWVEVVSWCCCMLLFVYLQVQIVLVVVCGE